MWDIFNEILYRPLLNILVFLYENIAFRDLGIAIILLTVVIRLVLFPLFYRLAKHQKAAQALQPKLKEIQEKHKNDRNAQAKATMDLYKEHGINPFTPLLMLLAQLPILIALYQLFIVGFTDEALSGLYSFIPKPEVISNTFLGLDLGVSNSAIALIAAITQYIQSKLSLSLTSSQKDDPSQKIGTQMAYILPFITLIILWSLPAAVGLYWLTGNVFSILQQLIINRHMDKYHGLGMQVSEKKQP